MFNVGPVEKKIYSIREEKPLLIPQIDPDKQSLTDSIKILNKLKKGSGFSRAFFVFSH